MYQFRPLTYAAAILLPGTFQLNGMHAAEGQTPQLKKARAASVAPVSFINDVAPILKENCFACHDSKKRKGKLDMTTYEGLRKGGTKDDPLSPEHPEDSLLHDFITAKDKTRMPPRDAGDPLPPEKIAVIDRWIREGA